MFPYRGVLIIKKERKRSAFVKWPWIYQSFFQDDHFGEIYRGMHNATFPFPLDRQLTEEDLLQEGHTHGGSPGEASGRIPHLKHPHAAAAAAILNSASSSSAILSSKDAILQPSS